mgnify:CR=1 FL=1
MNANTKVVERKCYINGEFVGGSDIMKEMYQSGELQKLLGSP